MLNNCQFIGNLGADPETRETSSSKVANMTVACTEKWTDKSGEKKERTEWVRCVIWGKLAEVAESYLRKGSKVYVSGAMQTRKWQDKDGRDQYTTEINVTTLKMLDPKPSERGAGSEYAGPVNDADHGDIPF